MDFPALMPKALLHYEQVSSEDELFDLLIQNSADLVFFFETAAADETWSGLHEDLIAKLITRLTDQAYNNTLAPDLWKRSASALQKHHHILEPLTSKNISVQLKDANIQINGLLLGATSEFFKDLIFKQCRDQNSFTLNLQETSDELFLPIEAYALTGNIPDLWKKEKHEVENLLRQSLSWGVENVNKACQLTLKKYINGDNVFDLLIQAQQELWGYFKQECIDFINDKMSGFHLNAPSEERLAFEFDDFSEPTLQVFQRLKNWITDLICRKHLIENGQFSSVVRQCPKLQLLDISNSLVFSDYLNDIPKDLEGINLAECAWLNQKTLKKIAEICPSIRELILSSNYQLNFAAWGELLKFQNLKFLDLSRCHQISDEDLMTILKGCPGLTGLVLDECRKIGDKGFFEIAKHLPRLTYLSLVHCSISESALLEIASRCRVLSLLNVSRCDQVTENGLKGISRHAFVLKELNVSNCNIPEDIIRETRQRYPYLHIETS